MNLTTFDQALQAPTPAVWFALAVAALFALLLTVMLLRAEKSVANTALALITFVALGVTAFVTLRTPASDTTQTEPRGAMPGTASLPALACVDDLAGEAVISACEKIVFGSPDATAAAVSYAASRLARLTALGDVATANAAMSLDLQALRQSIERDRYGLSAYVLQARDQCSPNACAAFQSLTDRSRIAANMGEKLYEGLVARYGPSWNAPTSVIATTPGVASMPSGSALPTGRPTNAEFPTSASIPPVSIMNPEPAAPAPRAAPPPAAARQTSSGGQAAAPPAAPKKQAAPKQPPRPVTPVQIAPPASSPPPAPADD